jgi:hypothetical protein
LNGDRGLRPRSPGDESGGEAEVAAGAAFFEVEAGVEGALEAEEGGLRVGDTVLRGFVAGRRLRGADEDADAGVPTADTGGALTLPALLLSASLSPARVGTLMRTRALAGVTVAEAAAAAATAARDEVDFRAVCLVLAMGRLPIAPTPRAISAMPLSSVILEALSSSSSSLSATSPGGGRARFTRPPPVLEPALGLGPGRRVRIL